MLFVAERRRRRRLTSAIRARDVRAADLQEKLTKRVEYRVDSARQSFRGFDEDGGSRRTLPRAERAIRQSERQRAEQSKPDRAPPC